MKKKQRSCECGAVTALLLHNAPETGLMCYYTRLPCAAVGAAVVAVVVFVVVGQQTRVFTSSVPDRPVGAGRTLPCAFVHVPMWTTWRDAGRCLGYLISRNPDHQVWLESSLQDPRGVRSHAWRAHTLRLLSVSLRTLLIGHLQLPNTPPLTHWWHALISRSGVLNQPGMQASILLA